jgi:methylated-DNA-[protein]-cysteine S-methyltransferase
MPDHVWSLMQIPCGALGLVACGGQLRQIYFKADAGRVFEAVHEHYPDAVQACGPLLERAVSQIDEYFAGVRSLFDLPHDVSMFTPFALRVYRELNKIPCGQVVTYGELAVRAGSPGAARAVGGVMAKNPYPLIVPCHRVVASSGALGGYSGGVGVESKIWLIEFEKSFCGR